MRTDQILNGIIDRNAIIPEGCLRYLLRVDILPLMISNNQSDWLEIDLCTFIGIQSENQISAEMIAKKRGIKSKEALRDLTARHSHIYRDS